MLPQPIRDLLNRLRRRERLLAFAWSAARWISVLGIAVLACCLIDNFVDLYRDTPGWALGLMRIALAALLVVVLLQVGLSVARSITDGEVALWVEERCPAFHHRLISAVQFNRPAAMTAGMSQELIGAVTRQAAQQAGEVEAARVVDGKRLRWAGLLAGPVLASLLIVALFNPTLSGALLGRLFGSDEEIPRSVALFGEVTTWPAGEEGVLHVLVGGRIPGPETTGEVRVEREDGTVSRHALEFAEPSPDRPGVAIYTARVPPGDVRFSYTARLADGRTKAPGAVEYAPRPVVVSVEARVQLPKSVGLRAGQQRYEEPQKGGDIVHRLPGSLARVLIATQKPIETATVHVLGRAPRQARLTLAADGRTAEGTFALRPDDAGYEVEVRDEHDFANADRPRRTVATGSLELPEVVLLPENFAPKEHSGPKEDYEAEGVPVAVDAPFKIEYACGHRYGLSHVQLRYRVLRRGAAAKEESGPIDTAKFLLLPLGPPRGQAAKATARALREFSTRPPASAESIPDTEGGGAYDFELTGIPDGQGGRLKINEGDRIQFFVEAFSKADPDGTPGRSVIREKEVVSEKAYSDWFIQKINLTERTRELEERQRGAAPPANSP